MAKNYDYFNVNKARKNLQDKKDAIYNHFNISHKIPEKLYIECTNLCNARCSFCYYKNKADAGFPKKFMSVDNFKKIIEQYTSIGGKHIALTPTLADPLTDPFFKNRLEYLDSSKIKTLDFYTNLISFGPKIQQAISNYKGSLSISVSFTGFNKSMYEQFMGVDKFDIVMENIGKLATAMKGKKNLRYHIIMRSYNNDKKEKADLEYRFKNSNIPFTTMNDGFDTWGGLLEEQMKADANIKIRKRLPRVGPCRVSYKKPVITVEGNFKICDCRDVFGALEVGNVFNETIEQIWHGQKIKDLREKFFTPEMLPEVCQKCEVYDSIYK